MVRRDELLILVFQCAAWWSARLSRRVGAGSPAGCVQDVVAQRFRLGFGEVAVEGEEAEPGEQVAGGGRGLAPGGAGLVVPGRQMAQAGRLGAADPVLDPGLGPVAGSGELDLPARGAGRGDLVPLALVLLEQGQLGAGVRVLAADQD